MPLAYFQPRASWALISCLRFERCLSKCRPLPSDMQPGAPPRTEDDDAEADDEGEEDAIVVHGQDGAPLSRKERRKFDATLRALMPGGTVDPLATSSLTASKDSRRTSLRLARTELSQPS